MFHVEAPTIQAEIRINRESLSYTWQFIRLHQLRPSKWPCPSHYFYSYLYWTNSLVQSKREKLVFVMYRIRISATAPAFLTRMFSTPFTHSLQTIAEMVYWHNGIIFIIVPMHPSTLITFQTFLNIE
jgi:hypothetical protein